MSPRRSASKHKRAPDGRQKSSTRTRDPLGGSPGNDCMKHDELELEVELGLGLGLEVRVRGRVRVRVRSRVRVGG